MGNALRAFVPTPGRSDPQREGAGGTDTTCRSVTGAGADAVPGTDRVSASSKAASVNQAEVDDDVETTEPDLGLCGFPPDLDFARWEECEPEPPIRESHLTAEQKAKFRGHLDRIFHADTLKGVRLQFDPSDILEVVETVIPYLSSESMLIDDVPFGVVVVADLLGQLHDLNRVFLADAKDGKPGWECMKYVFLGNYVDRGRQSLEIVMALYCIKMLYPDRIFLLRGDHEFLETNSRHGFALDFYDRYSEATWKAVFFKVNESFCYLSAAAIVGNAYFCASGGISPSAFTRLHLQSIRKPMVDSRSDVMVHDVVYSEIAKDLHGSTFNGGRRTSIYYGLDVLSRALYNMDCKMIIRGHTILEKGFENIGHLCFSLFTATGTKDYNDGAVALIGEQGRLTIRVLKCNKERVIWVDKLKRRDAASTNSTVDPHTMNAKM